MIRFRRTSPEVRLEMTPLLDVVFLLLTFFVFSLVLLVRAEVLDVRLPRLEAGRAAERVAAVTVALRADGSLWVDGEACPREELAARVRARREASPGARLYVAADEGGRSGDLLELLDVLSASGLGEFSVVGARGGPGEGTGGDGDGGGGEPGGADGSAGP